MRRIDLRYPEGAAGKKGRSLGFGAGPSRHRGGASRARPRSDAPTHPWVLLARVTLARPPLRGRGAPPGSSPVSRVVLVFSTRDPWAGLGQREANCSGLGDTRFSWQRPAQHERSTHSGRFVLAQAPPPANGPLCASAWAGPSLESESRSQGGALQLLNPTSRWREDCLPLHQSQTEFPKKAGQRTETIGASGP